MAHVIFQYADLYFNVKNNFYQIFTIFWVQIGPKIKSAQNLLKFGTFDISNMPTLISMSKMIFMKYLPIFKPKLVQKLNSAQNSLKSGTFNISSMPSPILMSKISFMKYLPPVKPKLVPKLKMLRIY